MDIKEKKKSSKFMTIGLTIAGTLASLIIIGLVFGNTEEAVVDNKEAIVEKAEAAAVAKEEKDEEEIEVKYLGFENIEKYLKGSTLERWKKLDKNSQIKMWNYFNEIMNSNLEEKSKTIIQNYMIEGVFLGKDKKELFRYIEDRIEKELNKYNK